MASSRELIVKIIGDSSSLEKTFRKTSADATKFDKSLGKSVRGAVAGTGAFKSLGRSLAFASGGFIAGASITGLLRQSIDQAQQAAVAQKQLAAQFKASGQNLAVYQDQIDKTIAGVSRLAGIEDDEVKSAFVLAFRATKDVGQGLRLVSIGADVARARHIALAQATLALNKAYGGNVGALRRLGITIPKSLTGMQALEFVARRFAGQARAGTTAQERFNAAFVNFQQIIGAELLPVFDKALVNLTKWLNNSQNQVKVQQTLNGFVKTGTTLVGALGDAWEAAAAGVKVYNETVGKLKDPNKGGLGKLSILFSSLPKQLHELVKSGENAVNAWKRLLGQLPGLPPGQSPIGENAFPRPRNQPSGGGGQQGPGALGFNARFAKLELALTKADRTATERDNRAILVQEAALIRLRLTKVKKQKDILALNEQLTGVLDRIAQIDTDVAQKERDANQKRIDANQRVLDALRARRARLKAQISDIQAAFRDALDTARQGLGDLFGGPVKPDVNEAARRTLGLHTQGTGVGQLTADLKAQTRQNAQFQRNLQTLLRRGAPAELVKELRAAGVAGAGAQAQTLAHATTPALKAFLTAFAKREKLAMSIAKATMKTQLVTLRADKVQLHVADQKIVVHTTVNLDGKKISESTTKQQTKAKRRTAEQRTGRYAGTSFLVQG